MIVRPSNWVVFNGALRGPGSSLEGPGPCIGRVMSLRVCLLNKQFGLFLGQSTQGVRRMSIMLVAHLCPTNVMVGSLSMCLQVSTKADHYLFSFHMLIQACCCQIFPSQSSEFFSCQSTQKLRSGRGVFTHVWSNRHETGVSYGLPFKAGDQQNPLGVPVRWVTVPTRLVSSARPYGLM